MIDLKRNGDKIGTQTLTHMPKVLMQSKKATNLLLAAIVRVTDRTRRIQRQGQRVKVDTYVKEVTFLFVQLHKCSFFSTNFHHEPTVMSVSGIDVGTPLN